MFHKIIWIFILVSTFTISCNSKSVEPQIESSLGVMGNTNDYYSVKKIVDGDTFWIDDGTEKGLKIRLIGVDAPESRNYFNRKKGYYGEEAKDYLTQLLQDKKVRLEYDVSRTDRYGRTLAYVYLQNGTFLNAELVKKGYAQIMTVPPNVKFAEFFLKLQQEAREKNRGLWSY